MRRPHSIAIERTKIEGYLLDASHPRGASKAKFFLAHGYDPSRPEVLANDLANLARYAFPGIEKPGKYGPIYEIRAEMTAPSGAVLKILSVWEIRADDILWFVTAYPG